MLSRGKGEYKGPNVHLVLNTRYCIKTSCHWIPVENYRIHFLSWILCNLKYFCSHLRPESFPHVLFTSNTLTIITYWLWIHSNTVVINIEEVLFDHVYYSHIGLLRHLRMFARDAVNSIMRCYVIHVT